MLLADGLVRGHESFVHPGRRVWLGVAHAGFLRRLGAGEQRRDEARWGSSGGLEERPGDVGR